MKLYYDLHIHSILSPCGSEEMTPNNIINMAMLKQLDIIAVTDHNTMLNVPAVIKVAQKKGIIVLPGIEVTTKEDIHALCYFKDINDGLKFQDIIYDSLPNIKNNEEIFGYQYIMDEKDQIIGKLDKLLLSSTKFTINEINNLAKEYSGAMVPAHVNKTTNSILSNLGFIPKELKLCIVEKNSDQNEYLCKMIGESDYNIITNSDAHYLRDISEPDNQILVNKKDINSIFNYMTKGG
ncbi:PHP domain-containing protein [Abyssisolibacter fermentans]|uniref:PHP domain-containing protein n=1 Tax=Abyssisolibacter fermentans TaxID=1766203 RepID=UPI000834242F|nr:PHP domain-containing protein [Abyssisolibacter fermentans]